MFAFTCLVSNFVYCPSDRKVDTNKNIAQVVQSSTSDAFMCCDACNVAYCCSLNKTHLSH